MSKMITPGVYTQLKNNLKKLQDSCIFLLLHTLGDTETQKSLNALQNPCFSDVLYLKDYKRFFLFDIDS